MEAWKHLAVVVHGEANTGGYNAVHKCIEKRYGSEAIKKLKSRYGIENDNNRSLFRTFAPNFFDYHAFPENQSIDKFVSNCSIYLIEERLPQSHGIEGLCALAYELVALEKTILELIDRMRHELRPGKKGYLPMIKATRKEVEQVIIREMFEKSMKRVFAD